MKMVTLYEKLIEEEASEIITAISEKNLEELLDGIGDYLWVVV
jgi:NTP pyrophosphatase (non-canonical NTP hydrolase)